MAAIEAAPVGARTRLARLAVKARLYYDLNTGVGTVARSERAAWASAQTLDDLCALTARWLTGDLKTQPGYYGSADVDEDDAPGLTDALVALNRAGFLTRNSQAGFVGEGYGGAHCAQVAAVDGFAKPVTVARLDVALADTPYIVKAFPRRQRGRRGSLVPVTWVNGEAYTRFAGGASARDVRDDLQGAGEPAVEEAVESLQVVVYDPEPGRNTLWADLRAVL